jgi:hypothetical protein
MEMAEFLDGHLVQWVTLLVVCPLTLFANVSLYRRKAEMKVRQGNPNVADREKHLPS